MFKVKAPEILTVESTVKLPEDKIPVVPKLFKPPYKETRPLILAVLSNSVAPLNCVEPEDNIKPANIAVPVVFKLAILAEVIIPFKVSKSSDTDTCATDKLVGDKDVIFKVPIFAVPILAEVNCAEFASKSFETDE